MTRQINLVGLNRPRGGRFGDCKPGHLACATLGARQRDSAVATLHFGPGDSSCTHVFLGALCVLVATTANLHPQYGCAAFEAHRERC